MNKNSNSKFFVDIYTSGIMTTNSFLILVRHFESSKWEHGVKFYKYGVKKSSKPTFDCKKVPFHWPRAGFL